MEEKLNLILDKLIGIETELKQVNVRLDNLEQGQNYLKKDIKDLSGMIKTIGNNVDSEIKEVNRKLDRLSAKQDIFSATMKEHELRLEDLEISPPIK